MLTFQPTTRIEHGAMVTQLGYAYCLDCRPLDRAQWMEADSVPGACDGCGRDFGDCTPLEISGEAAVEIVKCKVF